MRSQALTVAGRVIRQLMRDHRTAGIIVVVPLIVMSLIGLSFPDSRVLDYIAPALLATLALFFGFLLTGISFLRERSQGTLERLLVSPVSRLDIVLGYLGGFFVFAMLQAIIILVFTVYVFNVSYRGALWEVIIFELVVIIGAVNLGILTSTFARNEFQMVQFIPLIILPQVFLAGLLWPVAQMPGYLQWVSHFMPLTYAVEGLRGIMLEGKSLIEVWKDLAVLIGAAGIISALTALTLKRG